MSLLDRIQADQIQARRDKMPALSAFLGYLISEARKPGKDSKPPRESTDEEVVGVIRKTIARNDETLALLADKGLTDQTAIWQNKFLNAYLPEQLSEADLEALIREFVNTQNWTDEPKSLKMMGAVMSMLKECYPGKYSPQLASQVARRVLTE